MAEKRYAYDARRGADDFAEDDPLAELARIVGYEPRVAANSVVEAQRQEPAFNLEDELLREFERYEEPRHAPAPVVSETVPVVEPQPLAVPAAEIPEARVAVEPVRAVAPAVAFAPEANRAGDAPIGGARDLIEELEQSISGQAQTSQPTKVPQWAAANIRLPLANFHPAQQEPRAVPAEPAARAEPEIYVPAIAEGPADPVVETNATAFPAELDRHDDQPVAPAYEPAPAVEASEPSFDLVAAARDGVASDAGLTEIDVTSADDFAIDDLMADISRYPVPGRRPSPMMETAVEAPVAEMPVPAPTAAQALADPVNDDPFAAMDFDLDLEGIELELADLDFSEPQVPAPAPAPAPVAAVVEPIVPQPVVREPIMPEPIMPEPVRHEPVARVVPPAAVPEPVPAVSHARVAAEPQEELSDEDLPFDPSMISDADYHPEAVEMHVPSLPPVEQPQPVAPTNDFDFDVDAEIANLLSPVAKVAPAPSRAVNHATPEKSAPAAQGWAPPAAVGLDDFEKALEEDFRRSVNEPVERREAVSEVRIASASHAEDMGRARSMKRMLAAAAAIVIIGGVAYAGYSFMSGSGSLGIATGEPRIITADKDPVKVVPANPGGKTVPNQDKAVYDSVGGAAAEAPKQKTLVSSDEQPVDVVQRTLTPETMPEDNEGGFDPAASATPVADTQDPRLLPSGVAAESEATDEQSRNASIGARKVRTMIVKPDGTLVARDETAPAVDTAPATQPQPRSVQSQAIKPGQPMAAPTQVASANAAPTPIEKVTPAVQPAAPNVLAKAAAAAPGTVEPPVRAVQSSPVAETTPAPAPAARPAQKPVAAAPVDVAAVAPAAAAAAAPAAGGYGMQIASLPSEAEAKKTWSSLQSKFGSVLGGRNFEVRKAEIAGKGTFYRLRVPAGSKDEAAALCEKYRGAGGSCLISK